MIWAHVDEVPPLVSSLRGEVPTALADVIARCLEKSPADRYPDAASLESALGASIERRAWNHQDAHEWWHTHETASVTSG